MNEYTIINHLLYKPFAIISSTVNLLSLLLLEIREDSEKSGSKTFPEHDEDEGLCCCDLVK